jgi:hypothetical protein
VLYLVLLSGEKNDFISCVKVSPMFISCLLFERVAIASLIDLLMRVYATQQHCLNVNVSL